MSGTVDLITERLLLRKHQIEDAMVLFDIFGTDPQMFKFSGWNPYQTNAMAIETIERFMKNYVDPHFYGWGIVYEGRLIGTVGAYDYDAEKSRIEVGMCIERASWGHGFATEALTAVLQYLTEHEKIKTVSAWCASDNIGSQQAMEKSGMQMVCVEEGTLKINGQTYDKLIFERTMRQKAVPDSTLPN